MLVETAPTALTRERRAPDVIRRKVPRDIGSRVAYFIGLLEDYSPPKNDESEESSQK